jgi:hypothetical protein
VRVRRVNVAPCLARGGLLPLCLLLQLVLAQCVEVFEAYRLLQVDRGGAELGSRRATVNHIAASGREVLAAQPGSAGDLSRSIVLLRWSEATPEAVASLVDAHKASALLLVLPRQLPEAPSAEERERWAKMERFLLSRKFDLPVYFAFDDDRVRSVLDTLESRGFSPEGGDRFQLLTNVSEPSAIPAASSFNLWGYLNGVASPGADADSAPIVAVVAHYDSFAAAPELAFGAEENGAGVVALLEVARIFSRLYADFRTHGSRTLLFLLAGGGMFNFGGTYHWLHNADARVLETIEFALCIDGLASSDSLYLHVSKPPKTPEVAALYATFTETAQSMGIPFEIVHRKVNVSDPVTYWHHERFSMKRVMAATLSSRPAPATLFPAAGLLDRALPAAARKTLARNIRFIAEVLAKQVFFGDAIAAAQQRASAGEGATGGDQATAASPDRAPLRTPPALLDVAAQSFGVNEAQVDAWLRFLSRVPRVAPYVDKNSEFLVAAERALSNYAVELQKKNFPLDTGHVFFQAPPTEISSFKAKSFWFDLVLALVLVAYLAALHAYLRFTTWDAFVKRPF